MTIKKKNFKNSFQALLMITILMFTFNGCSLIEAIFGGDQVAACSPKDEAEEKRSNGYSAVGPRSMESYLLEACKKDTAKDANGDDKYMPVYSRSTGEDFQNARNAAVADITSRMAGQIQTRVAQLTKRSLNNEVISEESANSINKTVTSEKQVISQKISYDVIYTLSKKLKDEKDGDTIVKVEALAYYDQNMADRIAKEEIEKEMEKENEELHEDLNKLFDFPEESWSNLFFGPF